MSLQLKGDNFKILNDFVIKARWPIQIIQQILSFYFHIPLRIYNKQKGIALIDSISEYLKDNNQKEYESFSRIFEGFKKDKDTHRLFKHLKENCPLLLDFFSIERSKSPWVTYRSFSNPVLELLRRKKEWIMIEQFFFYSCFFMLGSKENEIQDYILGENFIWAYKTFDMSGENFLIIGPVWKQPSNDCGTYFEKEIVMPTKERIKKFFNDLDESEIIRISSKRYPLNEQTIKNRLEISKNVFERVLSARISKDTTFISREDITNLTLISFLVTHMRHSFPDIFLSSLRKSIIQFDDFDEILNKFNIDEISLEIHSFKVNFVEITYSKNNKFKLLLKTNTNVDCNKTKFLLTPKVINHEEVLRTVEYLFQDIKSHFFAHQNGCTEEWLVSNLFRLQKDYGILPSPMPDKEQEETLKKMYDFIISNTAKILTANTASLYFCRHDSDRCLDALSSYCDEDKLIAEKWEKFMPTLMREAADPDTRGKSLCYRAFDEGLTRFSWAYYPEDIDRTDPPGETLLDPPPGLGLESAKSGIATPIKIYGQTFGVLEVGGFSPYQFCYRNKYFLERISALIGPYLYQKHILHLLSEMNATAIDNRFTDRQKFDKFCRALSNIFLAFSASIWVEDEENPTLFSCMGCHNREDIKKLLDLNKKISIESSKSFLAPAIDSGTPEYKFIFPEDKTWSRTHFRDFLIEKKVKAATIIPVKHPEGNKVLVAIILFYQHIEPFAESWWESTFSFVSRQFSMLIQIMLEQKEIENNVRQIIAHEVKQKVDVVTKRAITIYHRTEKYVKKSDDIRHLKLKQKDLLAYTNQVHNLITYLDTREFWRLLRTGKHPIITIAREQIKKLPPDKINLRKEFFEVFMPRFNAVRKGRLTFTYNGPENDPFIEIHHDRLKNILDNLIVNAIKYAMKDTSIDINIALKEVVIDFSISNIAQCLTDFEELRIFTEGFRSDWAKEIDPSGKGLGLFIAKGLCELYSIELSHESRSLTSNICEHTFTIGIPKATMILND